jgi:hypothetical protein
MRSTFTLSSAGGWLSKNALSGLIQSYIVYCASSSMTIRSALAASLVDSSGLIEGLDNSSTITSSRVGALEEAMHARWSASRLSKRGTYRILKP